jgi:hypothetical protein
MNFVLYILLQISHAKCYPNLARRFWYEARGHKADLPVVIHLGTVSNLGQGTEWPKRASSSVRVDECWGNIFKLNTAASPPPVFLSLRWMMIYSFRSSSNVLYIWYIEVIWHETNLRTNMRRDKISAQWIYSLICVNLIIRWSDKLWSVLASTVNLGFGSHQNPWP